MNTPASRRPLDKLLIIAVGLLAYANSFNTPFVYDDGYFILDPRAQKYFWPLWKVFIPPPHFQPAIHRPLVTLSLAVNYALDGTEVWGYHAFNLTIHLLAALTLFAVLRRSFEGPRLSRRYGAVSRPLALAVALLWVAHPINTEAVTFIYQRAEAMMGLFYLLTLYGVIRSAESPGHRRWKLLAVAACALGMMSKQVMVTAPFLVFVYDRIFLSDSFARTLQLRGKLTIALAATLALPVFFFAIGHHENPGNFGRSITEFTPLEFTLNQPGILLHYLRLAFWPHPLMLDYGWILALSVKTVLVPILTIAALMAATLWALRRVPPLGFLGFAFFLILSPVCSFIQIGDPGAEHRFYLALAVVLTSVVLGGYEIFRAICPQPTHRQKRMVTALIACVVGALSAATLFRNYDYRSGLSIWSNNVAKRPTSFMACSNLGNAYVREGQYAPALELFQQSLYLRPNFSIPRWNLGVALFHLGQEENGIACLRAALEMDPRNAFWHYGLGAIYFQRGESSKAIPEIDRALQLEPDLAEAENLLGVVRARQNKREEALAHFTRAVEIQPNYAKGYHNMGITLARLGRLAEAAKALEKAYQLDESLQGADQKLVQDTGLQPGVAAAQ